MSSPYDGGPPAGPPPPYGGGYQPGYPNPGYQPGYPNPGQPNPGQPYPAGYPNPVGYPNHQAYPGQAPSGPPSDLSANRTQTTAVQRPAVIGVSASLTITASLLWIVLLIFGLLVALSVKASFSYQDQPEAVIYHLADDFQVSMGSGIGVWLFLLPLASVVAGFLLLMQRPWARVAYTVLGALTVGWSLWWLQDSVVWWVPAAAYVALAVTICWTPSVGRWYTDAARRRASSTEPASR